MPDLLETALPISAITIVNLSNPLNCASKITIVSLLKGLDPFLTPQLLCLPNLDPLTTKPDNVFTSTIKNILF